MVVTHTDDFSALEGKATHYILLVGIVAIGVGAFNGIRQASRAASSNFGLFNQAVSGKSDFLIESPVQRIRRTIFISSIHCVWTRTGI